MYGMGLGVRIGMGVWAGCRDQCMGWILGISVWDGCMGSVYGMGVGMGLGVGVGISV